MRQVRFMGPVVGRVTRAHERRQPWDESLEVSSMPPARTPGPALTRAAVPRRITQGGKHTRA